MNCEVCNEKWYIFMIGLDKAHKNSMVEWHCKNGAVKMVTVEVGFEI